MSHPSTPSHSGSFSGLLIFGVPIALAALLLPALFILVPSRQAQQFGPALTTIQTRAPGTAVSAAPDEVHLGVKEWSFTPKSLQLPVREPVTLVLDNTGQLD